MSVLSDVTIRRLLHSGWLIKGYPEWMAEVHGERPVHVGPASLDLHLGRTIRRMKPAALSSIGAVYECEEIEYATVKRGATPRPVWNDEEDVAPGTSMIIMPGEFILAETAERVALPAHVAGQVASRSSYGRMGLQVCGDAGFIDPGFGDKTPEQVEATGHRGTTITLELHNCGARPIRIEPGERICQLIIWRLDRPAEQPYGSKAGSQYQTQRGPTAPGGR